MPHSRVSAATKRYFLNPRKKTETQKYTELRPKINHNNKLNSLLNNKFLKFNLLNLLLISGITGGITTVSSTEITCNHGFEYRGSGIASWPLIQRLGWNTGYHHFKEPNIDENGKRFKNDTSALHVVDPSIRNTCKSKVACVSVVRYNHVAWGCTDRATKIYHTCAENFSKLKVPDKKGSDGTSDPYPCTEGESKKWDGSLEEGSMIGKNCMENRYCQNNTITLPYCIPLMHDNPTWVCDMYDFSDSKDKYHNCEHDKMIPTNSTKSDDEKKFVMKKNYYWMGTENTRYLKKNAHFHEVDRFVHEDNSLLESLPGEFHQPNVLVCDTDKCNTDASVVCKFMNTEIHNNFSSFEESEEAVKQERQSDLNANKIYTSFMTCTQDKTTTTKAYYQNFTDIVRPLKEECNSIPTSGEMVVYGVIGLIILSACFFLQKQCCKDPGEPDYEMAGSGQKHRNPMELSTTQKIRKLLFRSCCSTQHLHNDGTILFAKENHTFEYSR